MLKSQVQPCALRALSTDDQDEDELRCLALPCQCDQERAEEERQQEIQRKLDCR